MFGLAHCSFFHCLMNESSSIPEAEWQPLFLCPVCLRKMCKALKFDIATRYTAVLEQLRRLSLELHDTCNCGTREARGREGKACDTGDKHCASSEDYNSVVCLEQKHSTAEEVTEESRATCKQRVAGSAVSPDGAMQGGNSCPTCDCQLEHLRNATKWLEMQLGIPCHE